MVKHPEDKNAALLPHRIDGRWVLLHRPKTEFGGGHGEIVLSRSDDLVSWSAPEQVLQPRAGAWWDSLRIGIGPPPLRTEHGWLLLYHGVKDTVAGDMYRVGLALLDLDEPTRVLRRLPTWVLAPLADYERTGDVPNVVFPCGLLHDEASDEIRLYYGAADSSICLATARLRDLIEAVLAAPVAEAVGYAGRPVTDSRLLPIPAVEAGQLRARVETELVPVDVDPRVRVCGGAPFGADERRDGRDRWFR